MITTSSPTDVLTSPSESANSPLNNSADLLEAAPWPRLATTCGALATLLTLAAGRTWGAIAVYRGAPFESRQELGEVVIAELGAAGIQSLVAMVLVVLVALGAEGLILRLLSARRSG